MDIYLPIIQAMFADWLQVSEEHPLFVAAIAFCVWILVAILYSFRVSGLKKQVATLDTAKNTAETAFDTAQQQLQQAQDDLSTANQHYNEQKQASETLQQRAENVEKQLAERNQQLAAIIQKFASNFDIGERPVPITADLKADDLWQQHDKVVAKLLDSLRTEQLAKTELQKFYQAEKDKVVTIEARLDEQTSLLNTLQNQNNAAQHALSEAMQKHQADLSRLTQLEVTASQTAPAQIQPASVATSANNTDNLKNLFKKPAPKPVISTSEPVVTELLVTSVEDKAPALDVKPTPEPIVAPKSVAEAQPKTAPEPEKAGLKSVLNKFTTKTSVEKPIVAEVKSAPAVVEAKPASEPKEKTKLKGLFNKFTAKSDIEKPIVAEKKPAPVVTATPIVEAKPTPVPTTNAAPTINKAKGAYRVPDSKLSDDIPSTRIEDIADKITDTVEGFKKIFSKKS